MSNSNQKALFYVILTVYSIFWVWLCGIFGVVAGYGFAKFLQSHMEHGEEITGEVVLNSFLESKKYWLISLGISIGFGLVLGILGI